MSLSTTKVKAQHASWHDEKKKVHDVSGTAKMKAQDVSFYDEKKKARHVSWHNYGENTTYLRHNEGESTRCLIT